MRRKSNMAMPVKQDESSSVEIPKISNGYICRHSCYDGKGNYKSHEVFSAEKPQVNIPTEKAPAKRKPLVKRNPYKRAGS